MILIFKILFFHIIGSVVKKNKQKHTQKNVVVEMAFFSSSLFWPYKERIKYLCVFQKGHGCVWACYRRLNATLD